MAAGSAKQSRYSAFGHLSGYEDVNDAERLQPHALAYNLANFIWRSSPYPALCSETSWNGSTDCDDRPRRRPERGKQEMTEGEVCLDCAKMTETQQQLRLGHASAIKEVPFMRKRNLWLQDKGRLAIIGGEFRSHLGNVG